MKGETQFQGLSALVAVRTLLSVCVAVLAGCASLPDTRFISEQYVAQEARLATARGPVSPERSAAIIAELKKKSGDLDILDRQLALEEAIVGSPLVIGNKVTLLLDGPATYEAMFAAIRAATDHVNVESYIFEDGEVGQKFAELLLERQRAGVQVNVIYDSAGAFKTPKAFFDRLKAGGIQVVEFNPLNPLAARKAWSPNNRDHRKLMIVDGRTAFLGGINISNVYSSESPSGFGGATGGFSASGASGAAVDPATGWRDTDVQIDGPVVAEFQKLFLRTWEKQRGPALAQRNYLPTLAPVGKEIVRAVGSSPDDQLSFVYLTLISAITHAEKQVYITNAYFVPDPQLMKALLDAAARGVDVRMILPSKTDSATVFYAGRWHYEDLLRGGVKIYERQGALLHAKTAIIDGVWSCVGSSNLDWRSALDNDEVNAIILGREFAQQMLGAYASDIAASTQIDLETWQRRPLIERFRETTSRIWGRFL